MKNLFKYRYELVEENHHFTKKNDIFYRKSKIYKSTIDPNKSKILNKELVHDNNSIVMFDYSLIPKELIK